VADSLTKGLALAEANGWMTNVGKRKEGIQVREMNQEVTGDELLGLPVY
jgi:hypothetical protein